MITLEELTPEERAAVEDLRKKKATAAEKERKRLEELAQREFERAEIRRKEALGKPRLEAFVRDLRELCEKHVGVHLSTTGYDDVEVVIYIEDHPVRMDVD